MFTTPCGSHGFAGTGTVLRNADVTSMEDKDRNFEMGRMKICLQRYIRRAPALAAAAEQINRASRIILILHKSTKS
jgi:hypothetical protein